MRSSLSSLVSVSIAVLAIGCSGKDRDLFAYDPDPGPGGSNAGGAGGGDAGGSIPFDGGSGSGGTTPFGGVGGVGGVVGRGGAGGSGEIDSGANCDFCADGDGDGHGDTNRRTTACDPGPGWVTICDDCQDANPDVFPGSTLCRSTPYLASDGVTLSFDYDCSGGVSECKEVVKSAGSCAPMGLGCSGSGYVGKAEATDAGAGAAYCGATSYRVCSRIAPILCTATTETREPVECM